MAELTELNRASVAMLVFYPFSLAVAVLLASRHGFRAASGWLYLGLFSAIRIAGAALQLATDAKPDDLGLVGASMSLLSSGLSPLVLVSVGLLTRVLSNLSSRGVTTAVSPRTLRLVQLVVVVGFLLSLIGGFTGPRDGNVSTLVTVGVALMLAGVGVLVLVTAALGMQLRNVEHGERRILLAVAASLPFLAVRAIYQGLATYTSSPDFKWYLNGPNYTNLVIGMVVAMEMFVVVIIEGVGLTVHKLETDVPEGTRMDVLSQHQKQYRGYQGVESV